MVVRVDFQAGVAALRANPSKFDEYVQFYHHLILQRWSYLGVLCPVPRGDDLPNPTLGMSA